jgi:hypothetical protein
MRKIISILSFMVCLLVPELAFSMETVVETTGPQELSSLKTGIERSVITRCIARGIALEKYQKLTISISKLGDVISYDALLDTKPERAFHRDLKDIGALSATIDEMIGVIFTETGKTQAIPVPPAKSTTGQDSVPKIKLPFVATSIAAIGEKIFVSDTKTLYELKGEKTTPLWKTPGNNEILRIYPYGDSIIVLAKIINECRSFRIQGTEMKERWDSAVVPLGSGLVSTSLRFDKVLGNSPYIWTAAKQLTGSSPQVPEDFDILSAQSVQDKTSPEGYKIISFNPDTKLVVSNGKSVLWTDDTISGITPQFIENELDTRNFGESEPPAYYYLRPRIVVLGERIVTFRNSQGMARVVSGLNLSEFSQVLVYTPSGNDFTKEEPATFPESYCTDIALAHEKIAVLIVKDKGTYVQFLGL